MELQFAISSNIDYYEKTIHVIIPSLLRLGVDPSRIWLFVGDLSSKFCPLPTTYNIQSFIVPIRAFEFTAALAISDYFRDEERYWFIVHDTCYFGPLFFEKLSAFDLNNDLTPLNKEGQNNIGFCSTSQILGQRLFLDRYRGYTNERLYELKELIIREEGTFFLDASRNLGCRPLLDHLSPDDLTYGKPGRKLEYWPCLDLYKIKNNYGGKDRYGLEL